MDRGRCRRRGEVGQGRGTAAKMSATIVLSLSLLGGTAQAGESIRYVFAEPGSGGHLVYIVNGSRFAEEELPAFFDENRRDWPKSEVELRVIFRNDVSLAWFDYGCRSFSIRGFKSIRCYSGSERTGRAREMKGVGDVISLPVERW